MSLWGGVVSTVVNGVAGVATAYSARKQAKEEGAVKLAMKKMDLKFAKLDRKIGSVRQKEQNDSDYDMQVLRNRQTTWADEVLIVITLGIWLMHFVPQTQPYMASGWAAMGYNGVPWWFEFVIIGIFVSTLGLMRLFRLFFARKSNGAGQ